MLPTALIGGFGAHFFGNDGPTGISFFSFRKLLNNGQQFRIFFLLRLKSAGK
jgi:hypothetical protein